MSQQAQGILLPSFVMTILGKPGSGKTHMIHSMISNTAFFKGKFDRILYVGTTRYKGCIHDKFNTNAYLDMDWINQALGSCKGWAQNILIIMDDIVSQINPKNRPQFQELLYNRRHKVKNCTISLIITTQKFTALPTWIRVATNQLICFPINNSQLKYILKEITINKTKDLVQVYFKHLKPHQFIYFNLNTGITYNHDFIQL